MTQPTTAPTRRRRGWRIVRRVLAGLLVLVILALVGGYWYARPLLLTGTGYAAHNDCAIRNITGRTDPLTDLPPNPLVPYLRTTVDRDTGTAQASLLGLLSKQTAYYTPGYGCTVTDRKPALKTATAVADGVNPLTTAPHPTATKAVEAAVAQAFGDDLAPAAKTALGTRAVIVVQDGHLIAERYADGFTAQTRQLGWSMTKSVGSLLAGRLAAQGKLALTDAALRPEWTDARKDITVDQLLRMTSGLQWDETYDLGTPITRMLFTEPDMAGYAASLPLAHASGTVQQYSSGSTNILCSVLQRKAGRDGIPADPDFAQRELFAPLGLTSAVLETDATGLPVCSSYLWATPRDWAAIGQFALDNGRWNGTHLLPENWMAQTTTVHKVDQTDDPPFAASWRSNTLPDGTLFDPKLPKDAYWAQGHDGQWLVVVPSAKLVVVRMGFSPKADDLRVNTLVAALAALPQGG